MVIVIGEESPVSPDKKKGQGLRPVNENGESMRTDNKEDSKNNDDSTVTKKKPRHPFLVRIARY